MDWAPARRPCDAGMPARSDEEAPSVDGTLGVWAVSRGERVRGWLGLAQINGWERMVAMAGCGCPGCCSHGDPIPRAVRRINRNGNEPIAVEDQGWIFVRAPREKAGIDTRERGGDGPAAKGPRG